MVDDKIINTTVGRVIFNDALPKGMPFVNGLLKKKGLQELVSTATCARQRQDRRDARPAQGVGFLYATRPGSRSASRTWSFRREKALLVEEARAEVIKVEQQYLDGAITNGERYNKVIDIWSDVTEKVADAMFGEMK